MPVTAAVVLLLVGTAPSASREQTVKLLHGYRHGYLPYALPRETGFAELDIVASKGFDVVGVGFCGPYDSRARPGPIDFSKLDEAVARLARRGIKTLIHLNPRFVESEGIGDVLNTGRRVRHVWNKNPNYAMLDVFDEQQVAKFNDYLVRAARRYGKDDRVVGFCIGWGYQAETGFYTGDFVSEPRQMGSASAGYSPNALREFNRWRVRGGLQPVDALPQPSTGRQSQTFIDFMHFRYEYVGRVFQAGAVAAMQRVTDKPIGLFGYLPAGKESYARAWCATPNADFYRSAGSAGSYDIPRTLIDSGIGWEDSLLHAGRWDFTAACMRRDEVRMMAHGGVYHAMYCRVYATEPQWEKDIYAKVSDFLLHNDVAGRIRRYPATVALFLPTWSCAAFPGRSAEQPFLPPEPVLEFIRKHVGIVESFGLRYKLITEDDLARPETLERYELIIVVAGNHLDRILPAETRTRLRSLAGFLALPFTGAGPSRSVLRDELRRRGVRYYLDYESDQPVAGMVNNVVLNFSPEPVRVLLADADGKPRPLTLAGHEYRFCSDPKPFAGP